MEPLIGGGKDGRRWLSAAVFVLAFVLLILFINQAVAGANAVSVIAMRTADIQLQAGIYTTAGSPYAVLKLARSPRQAELEALAKQGVRLLSYLTGGAYIAGLDPGALTTDVIEAYGITAAAPWGAENKATAELRRGQVDEQARTQDGQLKLAVLFFADVDQREAEAILGRHAERYDLTQPPRTWTATVSPAKLPGLLSEQGIHLVDAYLPLAPALDEARALVHVDEVQDAVISSVPLDITYNGLTGKGITLQVSEEVWDGHPDFEDRNGVTRFLNPSPSSGGDHGTGVASIMAGNGRESIFLLGSPSFGGIGRWRGMAPEANLYESYYYGDQGRLVDASNHSFVMWDSFASGYGSDCFGIDEQIRNDPDYQWPQIWAAGNNGLFPQHDDEEGYYAIGSAAKNNIVVGSVDANGGALSSFSSMGPTFDGRIKPDVMAPGGKNHIPRGFDLVDGRMQVWIDYIRIMNEQTGAIDAQWEFNSNGDTQGWFPSGSVENIYDVTAQDGSLTFNISFQQYAHGIQSPYGWNRNVNVQANPNHVIVMRYKMNPIAGATSAEGAFWYHHPGDADNKFGTMYYPIKANNAWQIVSVPVGRWATSDGTNFDGWRGTFDYLGMIVFAFNAPRIVHPAHFEEENGADFYGYEDSQGTSEAAPVVTGGVALILQQMEQQWGIDVTATPPLPSTVKAILIQTAQDLEHETADPRDPVILDTGAPALYYEGPDFATGYGLVNIKSAVDLVAEDPGPGPAMRLIHENELDGYQRHVYELAVGEDTPDSLQFTLAWDDFPGDPTLAQTTPKLVNDLDLSLIGPDGTTYLPWTLDPLPVAYCDGAGPGCGDPDPIAPEDVVAARKDVDHLNNVEMVQVSYPQPGRWLVVVGAYDMPMPLQSYSLAGSEPSQLREESEGGITTRVSVDSAGAESNNASERPAISADARTIAFDSDADNLVQGDSNEATDIFVHDRQTGDTVRVSFNSGGRQANAASHFAAISADGRFVAFRSHASNLVPDDTNNEPDIFIHDRDGDQDGIYDEAGAIKTTRVSVSSSGDQANNASYAAALSADGRYVAFESAASNLVAHDDNSDMDVFVHDRQTGQTTLISRSSAGKQGNGYANSASISGDGRYVAFESSATNLVTGDTNEATDIFVHDRQTGQTILVSRNEIGDQSNSFSSSPAISANGRYVAFWSFASNLVYGDENGFEDVFVHDTQTGRTELVSQDSNGQQADSSTIYPDKPAISADGRFVAFGSDANNLVIGDTSFYNTDIFIRDMHNQTTKRASVSSTQNQANSISAWPALSADGRFLAFSSSASNLVSGDTNQVYDIFLHEQLLHDDVFADRLFTPAQENIPGSGWMAGIQVQNGGSETAKISYSGIAANGQATSCGEQTTEPGESANFLTYWGCPSGHPVFNAGVVTTDQPALAISNVGNNLVGKAQGQYRAADNLNASKTLFFPLVKQNHIGRTTAFSVQNTSSEPAEITAVFQVQGETYSKIYKNVPGLSSVLIIPANAGVPGGNGQVGSLTVTGSQPLAGASLEYEQDAAVASNLQSAAAFTAADYDTALYCPLFRNAHAAKKSTSGLQVQNVSSAAQNVQMTYTPSDGSSPLVREETIQPGASATFYAPAIGIPAGSLGSVVVQGAGDIVAVVNERAQEANGQLLMTTYQCFPASSATATVMVPLYKEMYLGNTSGIQVQNVSGDGRAATVTVTYRATNSAAEVAFSHSTPIPDGGSITFWGVSDLLSPPGIITVSGRAARLAGTYGSVTISSDMPIVAIVNESTTFTGGSGQDSKNYEGFNR